MGGSGSRDVASAGESDGVLAVSRCACVRGIDACAVARALRLSLLSALLCAESERCPHSRLPPSQCAWG